MRGSVPWAIPAAIGHGYYGGYTQSELARQLGISLGTVKSRMFNGLARLRSFLTETPSGAALDLESAMAG